MVDDFASTDPGRMRLLETILQASPAFIHVLRGPDFVFEFANAAYYQLVGHRELIGLPAFKAMPEAAVGGYPERIAKVMASRQPFHGYELPVMLARTAGAAPEERLIDLVYVPLIEADGSCHRVLGHGTDVTENVRARQLAQRQQKATQERLESALAAGRMATWEWNLRDDVVTGSESIKDILGLPLELAAFDQEDGLRLIHPDDREAHRKLVEEALVNGDSWHTEYRAQRPDGQIIWLEERAHLSRAADTGKLTMVGLVWDVSSRKVAELALVSANQRKNDFLATLAHELRNPLAAIRAGLQVIKLASHPDDRIEKTGLMMARQMAHLVRLVDDLLELSRISLGKVELQAERVLLRAAVSAAAEANVAQIGAKGIELVQEGEEEVIVVGDRVRITQAVSNLLGNATKFSESGSKIWLSLQRDGDDAVIQVRDKGCGIEPERIATVFDMFSQGPSHAQAGGLGIGLSLTRQFVELHGGRLTAASDGAGSGSTFTIRLPAVPLSQMRSAPSSEQTVMAKPDKLHILVIDDNRDAADALSLALQIEGHTLQTAYDGPSGLALFEANKPDVVLLDIGMPGMSGYEVARLLRRDRPETPPALVALTGFGMDSDRRDAQEAGFDRHLTKPVDYDALNELLSSLCKPTG